MRSGVRPPSAPPSNQALRTGYQVQIGALFPFCSLFQSAIESPYGRLQLLPGEVGIAEGHADILVAEQTHYGLQVDPVHIQVAGEGVSQIVEVEVFDAGLATRRVERTFHLIVGLTRFCTQVLEQG